MVQNRNRCQVLGRNLLMAQSRNRCQVLGRNLLMAQSRNSCQVLERVNLQVTSSIDFITNIFEEQSWF